MDQCLKRLLAVVLPVLLLVSISACSNEASIDRSWVLGKWELVHNPENDDEDVLIFDSDDTVTVLTEKGEKIHGEYRFDGNSLKISLPTPRKIIEVEFEVSSDHGKLIYASGAYYMKK